MHDIVHALFVALDTLETVLSVVVGVVLYRQSRKKDEKRRGGAGFGPLPRSRLARQAAESARPAQLATWRSTR
jgi:hypothetical protein